MQQFLVLQSLRVVCCLCFCRMNHSQQQQQQQPQRMLATHRSQQTTEREFIVTGAPPTFLPRPKRARLDGDSWSSFSELLHTDIENLPTQYNQWDTTSWRMAIKPESFTDPLFDTEEPMVVSEFVLPETKSFPKPRPKRVIPPPFDYSSDEDNVTQETIPTSVMEDVQSEEEDSSPMEQIAIKKEDNIFELSAQPRSVQRRCYLKENRYVMPNPLVVRCKDEALVSHGTVNVQLVDAETLEPIVGTEDKPVMEVNNGNTNKNHLNRGIVDFTVKILVTSGRIQFRFLFTVQYYASSNPTELNEQKILSDPFTRTSLNLSKEIRYRVDRGVERFKCIKSLERIASLPSSYPALNISETISRLMLSNRSYVYRLRAFCNIYHKDFCSTQGYLSMYFGKEAVLLQRDGGEILPLTSHYAFITREVITYLQQRIEEARSAIVHYADMDDEKHP
ncbi:hypothetical protein PROFUN_07907 [Planoprotostelium fungivorum]|uniref:Uncharacterized protein n=1 Tax=Planoprotostelium fungivorum TaxID=1890364 RepID=A0A2P6NL19_9EUKA|nr:hypothetical protein PROFUN_07907 [Planoprotostelium fungivorum]